MDFWVAPNVYYKVSAPNVDHDWNEISMRCVVLILVTKAEDKKSNIQAAIKVFENWIEQNGGSSSSKKSSDTPKEDKEKPDTVPGLGFKDKEAALKTLK